MMRIGRSRVLTTVYFVALWLAIAMPIALTAAHAPVLSVAAVVVLGAAVGAIVVWGKWTPPNTQ